MRGLTCTVVIASVGRPDDLRGALSVVPDEIVVVAQHCDNVTQQVARDSGARVVVVEKPGLALAIETGISHAKSDVVAFLDDDARARSDWLEQISFAFGADSSLGLLGGRDNVDGDDVSVQVREPVGALVRGKLLGNHHLGYGLRRTVLHVKGANMSVRRAAGLQVPLAALVVGSGAQVRNELILSLAIRRLGYTVAYDPRIQVDHFPAKRLDGDERMRLDPSKVFVRRSNEAAAVMYSGDRLLAWPFFMRAIFIGERTAPGLVILSLGLKQRRRALRLFRSAVSGLADGASRGYKLRNHRESSSK
jgi:glycosyltransferase involved in cell wall biosynthesis